MVNYNNAIVRRVKLILPTQCSYHLVRPDTSLVHSLKIPIDDTSYFHLFRL